jgi:hypothetical protein
VERGKASVNVKALNKKSKEALNIIEEQILKKLQN